jgi:F-type H+-transporting ATPase subunit alpha
MDASDHAKPTQPQLALGHPHTEILKQNQYSPIAEEKQIVIILAATSGLLDAIPVADCRRFEADLYSFLDARHADLLKELRDKKDLKGDLGDRVKAALQEFTGAFQPRAAS